MTNAAAAYGLEHTGQTVEFARRHGVPYDQREDVVQGALLRCLRQGDKAFGFPQAYWYAALKSEILDSRRRNIGVVHLTDEMAEYIPAPSPPPRRSLNGFGSSRAELEAVYEWLGHCPQRWQVIRKHLRGASLSGRAQEMIEELRRTLAEVKTGG